MSFTGILKLALLATLTALPALAQVEPQSAFTSDDEAVQHPADISSAMLDTLKADIATRWSSEDGRRAKTDWFSAEKLRSPDKATDLYMVMGVDDLRGANANPFWLVSENRATHTATVLWVSNEHEVALRYHSRSHLPDIVVGTTVKKKFHGSVFRFRRGKYVEKRTN